MGRGRERSEVRSGNVIASGDPPIKTIYTKHLEGVHCVINNGLNLTLNETKIKEDRAKEIKNWKDCYVSFKQILFY